MKVLASTLALAVVPALAAPIAESADAAYASASYDVSTVESLPGAQNGAAWLFSANGGPMAGQGTTLKFYENNELSSSGRGRAWVLEIDDSEDIQNSALMRYATQFQPRQGKRAQQAPPPPPLGRPLTSLIPPRPASGLGVGAGTLAGARTTGTTGTTAAGSRNVPAVPGRPASPAAPAVPAQPAVPRVPAQPAAPAAPRVPAAPKAAAVPAAPKAPSVPAVPVAPVAQDTPASFAAANVSPENPEQLPDIGGLLGNLPPLPDLGGVLAGLPVLGPLLGGAKSGDGAAAAPAPAAPAAPAGGASAGSIPALTQQIGEQIGDRIGEPIGSAIGSRIGKAIGQPIGSTIGGAIGNAIQGLLPPPRA